MAFKAELCKAWVEARAPGERFVSYVVTGTNAPVNPAPVGMRSGMTFTGTEALRDLADRLGFEDGSKVGIGAATTFLALTDRQIMYGTRSSVRNRPKDLLHASPAANVTLHWIDEDSGAGNRFRHLLLDFGDGGWRNERIGLSALNRDMSGNTNLHHFFEALGDRARPIEL